jgi:hypothetical protein
MSDKIITSVSGCTKPIGFLSFIFCTDAFALDAQYEYIGRMHIIVTECASLFMRFQSELNIFVLNAILTLST